jgi:NAD(P) transhydrogenase subunit alpha
LRIAVARETREGETRVALVPDTAGRLVKAGHEVAVEASAGALAGHADDAYRAAGARVGSSFADAASGADVVVRVSPPTEAEARAMPEGVVLVGLLHPLQNLDAVGALLSRRVTAFALDLLPRTTRAQAMDVLSSMSTIAGYRAALLGAHHTWKFFPMLMTAAGTIPPARVLVVGAGVAGLQAIATCRRLGAIVEAYDVRASAREEAKSLGATVVDVELGENAEGAGGYAKEVSGDALARQQARLADRVRAADVVITTALVPGKPAPKLVPAEAVARMRPGSTIVDLAAETGGNCPLTRAGEVIQVHGVTIVGLVNLAASMPGDASRLFSKNVQEVLQHVTPKAPKDGPPPTDRVRLDFQDEITAGAVALHAGDVRHAPTKEALGARRSA